jgi:hypothetical protein
LASEEEIITDQTAIEKHIVAFYKKLFEAREPRGVHLREDFWDPGEMIDAADRELLEVPFSEKEVRAAIANMKSNSAPGPNGFIVVFFKKLWGKITGVLLKMVRDFNNNNLDLKRLNFGVITLVPKLQDANKIKQYKLIYLLNVDFKIFPKLLIDRVTLVTDKVISDSQTAFIKGGNIL